MSVLNIFARTEPPANSRRKRSAHFLSFPNLLPLPSLSASPVRYEFTRYSTSPNWSPNTPTHSTTANNRPHRHSPSTVSPSTRSNGFWTPNTIGYVASATSYIISSGLVIPSRITPPIGSSLTPSTTLPESSLQTPTTSNTRARAPDERLGTTSGTLVSTPCTISIRRHMLRRFSYICSLPTPIPHSAARFYPFHVPPRTPLRRASPSTSSTYSPLHFDLFTIPSAPAASLPMQRLPGTSVPRGLGRKGGDAVRNACSSVPR